MAQDFTIEDVKLAPLDKSRFIDPPPFDYRMVLFGRMADGRAFVNEQWLTQELLDDRGESQLIQDMRESAHPPGE